MLFVAGLDDISGTVLFFYDRGYLPSTAAQLDANLNQQYRHHIGSHLMRQHSCRQKPANRAYIQCHNILIWSWNLDQCLGTGGHQNKRKWMLQ